MSKGFSDGFSGQYGLHYSDQDDCYRCFEKITYEDYNIYDVPGERIIHQKMILNGKPIGIIQEIVKHYPYLLKPKKVSFILFINDDDEDAEGIEENWNYMDGEMAFANLRDCVEWYKEHRSIVNTDF